MNTFLDYIEWRGDIEFSYDGFNEVDNMLLSTLAYSDYENVIDADSAPLDLDTVRKRYFHFHTREEVGQRKPRSLTAPLLMDDLIQSKRFQDLKIGYYVNHVSEDSVTQFSAMTMDFNDFVYIAFRGTDNSLTGWKEDLLLSFKSGIHAQVFAVDYLNRYMKDETRDIIVGGHSKGGNLAVYAAAFCEASIRDKIKIIYSNDGPGFLKEITESENYLSIKDRIYSIIPESSIVGLLLNNDIEHHVIKSYSTGMHQHDPYSWLVYRNSFVREERISKSNAFLDKTLDDWLNNLSEEEKETFVAYLSEILTASGEESIEGIKANKLKATGNMIKAGTSLSKEQFASVSKIVGQFISSGGSTLFESLIHASNAQKEKLLSLMKKDEVE